MPRLVVPSDTDEKTISLLLESNMPKLLWISRHNPLPAQLAVLERKLGDFILFQHSKPLSNVNSAISLIKKFHAEYVIPVLPMSFIIYLINEQHKHGFTVLKAEMDCIHCPSEFCEDFDPYTDTIQISRDIETGEVIRRHFRFRKFSKLNAINIDAEVWAECCTE